MVDDDLGERVARLEARMDGVEKAIDKMSSNDFVHVEARLNKLESRRNGGLTGKDWVAIITTIIIAAASITVAIIQVLK